MRKTGKTILCKLCGKPFYAAGWELKEGRKFCSYPCSRKDWASKLAGWNKGLKRWWKSPTEFKKGETSGERNVNWKNGKTKTAAFVRFTPKYKAWRTAIFERDNYICQKCQERGVRLNAEHIKPQSLFPELRFDVSNGLTLCVPCHKKTYSYLNAYMRREEFL